MADVLVTGAHGFIGRHLARHLAALGHRVAGVGHGLWPAEDAARWGTGCWLNGDVVSGNLDLVQRRFGSPSLIFHLAGGSSVGAAIANPREDYFRSVESTAELLSWMRHRAPQASLVAVSSAAVYGSGHEGPIAVDTPLKPYSTYGRHKQMMEELCRSHAGGYGMRIAVARLFSVYGPGLRKQLLWDLCSRLADAPQEVCLGGTGNELRDWTHVEDVVSALARMCELSSSSMPVINLGTGSGTSVATIASEVIECWTGPGQARPGLRFSGQSRPGDPVSLIAGRAEQGAPLFEWRHGLAAGIAGYVRWFRGQSLVD